MYDVLLERYGMGTLWSQNKRDSLANLFGQVDEYMDITSPFIYNIVCNAVIREWESQMNNGTAQERKETRAQFYVDDGLLSGEKPQEVQRAMDIFTNIFARVGLKMNATKMKAMTMVGSKVYASISKIAYTQRITGEGHTHRERNIQKVECEL
jgi:hypothetical protein